MFCFCLSCVDMVLSASDKFKLKEKCKYLHKLVLSHLYLIRLPMMYSISRETLSSLISTEVNFIKTRNHKIQVHNQFCICHSEDWQYEAKYFHALGKYSKTLHNDVNGNADFLKKKKKKSNLSLNQLDLWKEAVLYFE